MGTRGRAGLKKSSKGHVSKRNVKSDDSDEDYMLEEDELDDETDELESLAGDASDEESFGDKEGQHEIVKKVVRSTPRKRSVGQKKNEISISSKRRRRTAYSEEENNVSGDEKEEENDYDNDHNTVADPLQEEHQLPYSKGNIGKRGNTYDDEFSPVDQDISDEENLPSSKRKNKKKGDSDDDDFNPDEHDILDEEEELLSQKRKKEQKGDTDDDDFGQDFSDEEELSSPEGEDKKKCESDDDEFNPDDIDFSEEEEDLPSPKGKKKKKHESDDDEFNSDDLEILDDEEDLPCLTGKCKEKSDTDDDDDFFPDDLDLFDEEENIPCSNKRRWQNSLKRKRSMTAPKIKPQKKKRKKSSKSTKSTSVKSRKLKNKAPSSKRLPKRRKKNAILPSDSDFASFDSTDHEFTISEEEREQVREANEIFQRETSKLRCVVKRDQGDEINNQPKKLSRRKGKEKVEEVKGDVGKQVCGICLTKEGKNTVRGTLNCCNHFFCCACIIEWSKVESRCPVCKQRFVTISKSAESAIRIDHRNVVIPVPERDQVYHPSEEELRGYLDPYGDLLCTECHEGGDDALMLLCDICDSPAHTYCVGLGREVPDGNWYCEGCLPSALGFTTSHVHDHTFPSERPDNNLSVNEPLPFENMAEIDLNITIPETPMAPGNGFLVSPSLHPPPPLSGVGVSTLSGRRMVHRLRFLRSSNRSDRSAQPPFIETTSTTEYLDRLQEVFPGRQNFARAQALQVPSVGDTTSYGFMQFGQVAGREWLQHCTSRMSLGTGTSMAPMYNGEADQNTAKQLQ